MKLEDLFLKHKIKLKDEDGDFRHPIDIIEDMYLKLNGIEFNKLCYEISEEELKNDIFNECRMRHYGE